MIREIKLNGIISMLYGYANLHILTYKDTAIITTAKQGSTYLKSISKLVREADNHIITLTSQVNIDNTDGLPLLSTVTTAFAENRLKIKNTLSELFNGKDEIKRILILYRNPLKKIKSGLYQDFTNLFPPYVDGDEENYDKKELLNILLSKQLNEKISSESLRNCISFFEGRLHEFKNPYSIPLEKIEEYVQDLFITYCKQQLYSGLLFNEGHTKPWCKDAILWANEFERMGLNVKFFNLDKNEYDLKDTLSQTYKLDYKDNEKDRGAAPIVSKWFGLDKFVLELDKPLANVLQKEMRAYDYIESDIRNITKPS